MSLKWSDAEQRDVVTIVGLLQTGMVVALFALPAGATYPLGKFDLPLRAFLLPISVFWGVFLFWMLVSRLPVGKRVQIASRAQALWWLLVVPGITCLFFLVVAMDVTYPFLDPLVIPTFVLGCVGLTVFYLRIIGINAGSVLVRGLRRIAQRT